MDVFSGLNGENDTVLATPAIPLLLILKPRPSSLIAGYHVDRSIADQDLGIDAGCIGRNSLAIDRGDSDGASASETLPEGSQGLFPSRYNLVA